MARALTAMVCPAEQVTYCSSDGVPYRSDDAKIIHVRAEHVAQLTGRGLSTATAANFKGTHHNGESLVITGENGG